MLKKFSMHSYIVEFKGKVKKDFALKDKRYFFRNKNFFLKIRILLIIPAPPLPIKNKGNKQPTQ